VNILRKIIAGGQTGVDQAALRAARDCGLEIGGWCPPGRVCEVGAIPAEFPLEETEQERSPSAPDIPRSQRTEWNVRDSEGALVIGSGGASRRDAATEDPGTEWAVRCAERYGRPLLVCDLVDPDAKQKIQAWLRRNQIKVLSVGGPAESTSPGIGDRAYRLLREVFEDL
jgi:Circularly permutated YpsA SLOG family